MVRIAPLRDHPELCEFFARAFEQEWPTWYGPEGPGEAAKDLQAFANPGGELPVGVVALDEQGRPLGIAALKATSIASHAHLAPWATAGYVAGPVRRQGIGARLLRALIAEAGRLGYPAVYCATATAASLLRREGWHHLGDTAHDHQVLGIYSCKVAR